MERAHVAAWPALETTEVRGWLWRYSGGGSQRANSVSALDFSGGDVDAAVAEVEARYRRRAAPARFHTYEETRPAGLADVLRRRGYRQGEATVTMFREPVPAGAGAEPAVELREAPWEGWLGAYLGVITEDRREVNRRILERVPAPRAFFGLRRQGRIVATALGVASHGCVVDECVATVPQARRTGAAGAAMRALLAWACGQRADLVGLQVVAGNEAAARMYQGLAFAAGAKNRFWIRAEDGP